MDTDVPVESLNLPQRVTTALKNDGMDTVAKVIHGLTQGDEALLITPGIGPKSLAELKVALRQAGYRPAEFTLSPGLSIAEVEAEVLTACPATEGSVEGAGLNGASPAQTKTEASLETAALPKADVPALSFGLVHKVLLKARKRQYIEALRALDAQVARVEKARDDAQARIAAQRHEREQQIATAHNTVDDIQKKLDSVQAQAEQMQRQAQTLTHGFDVDPAMAEADAAIYHLAEILGDETFGEALLAVSEPKASAPSAEELAAAQQATDVTNAKVEAMQLELLEAEENLNALLDVNAEQRVKEDADLARIHGGVEQAIAVLAAQREKLDAEYTDVVDVIREREERRARRAAEQQAAADELRADLQRAWGNAAIEAVEQQARERGVLHLVTGPAAQRRRELQAFVREGIAFATSLYNLPGDNVLAVATPSRQVHVFYANGSQGVSKARIFAFAQKSESQAVSVAGGRADSEVQWAHWKSWQLLDGGSEEIANPLRSKRRPKSGRRSTNSRRTHNAMAFALKRAGVVK